MKHYSLKISFLLITLCPFFLRAQSIPEIISTLEIDTLINGGAKDNRINFAVANVNDLNDNAYTSKDALTKDLNFIIRHFNPGDPLAKKGFSQYRNFFNLYTVWFPEPLIFEPVPSYYQTAQGIRDQLFLPWANDQNGWVTMMYTLSGGGGGGAGVVREKRVGDILAYGLEWATVLHEFNHTMPGVLDEYTASGIWSNYECLEGPNTTGGLLLEDIPWRKWISPETPIPTPYTEEYFEEIGVFEGTISGYFGCHRPSARGCYMGAGGFGEGYGDDMCVVCHQRFICMMYQYVDVIEEVSPSNPNLEITGAQSMTFSANMVKPMPNTQKYEWFLNGKLVAKNVESVTLDFGACANNELTLVVTDTTEHVRFDEKFADRYPEPKQSHTWYINQTDINSYDLTANIEVQNADCTGIETGEISIQTQGGKAPYSYFLENKEVTDQINNLSAGDYQVNIIDALGCGIEQNIEVKSSPIIDFEIVSNFSEGAWELSPRFFGESPLDLQYEWFDGQHTKSIKVLEAGVYSLKVLTPQNCSVIKSIDFTPTTTRLNTQHIVSQSASNIDNGAIYLSIDGGKPPYKTWWYQGESKDLTSPNPGNVISSGNGEIERHLPAFAFDDIVQYEVDFWAENFRGDNYIGYDFGSPKTIDSYSITSNLDVRERDAKNWTLQGSNDQENWTNLQEVTDYNFTFRLQKDVFFLEEPATYQFFRILITANQGDGWVAIQEVEFGSIVYNEIEVNRNQLDLINLAPGRYQYITQDENQTTQSASLSIENKQLAESSPIKVIQDGYAQVIIEGPNPALSYHWFASKDATQLLHIGDVFQPKSPGNYYVRALQKDIQTFGEEIKGFAVTMVEQPNVNIDSSGMHIENPKENNTYVWYDQPVGGSPVFIGPSFTPSGPGTYYVSARMDLESNTAIDPLNIPGISLWMDASDLDGDGETDASLASSSAYSWKFRQGGRWKEDSWFPYRGNYQNGLGVVDFATLWFQYLDGGTDQIQTIIMAYEENDLSFPNSAPIYGLLENIPKHENASQLFSNSAPARTLNGNTYLNGKIVDPLKTANPLEFMLLSVVMTEKANTFTFASHEYWEGKVGEIITYDHALSPSQVTGINEFLRKKWISTADLESPRTNGEWQNITTSVEDQIITSFQVFPNPSSGIVNIQSNKPGKWFLTISDLSGRTLYQEKNSQFLKTVDLSNFQNGLYIFSFREELTGMIHRHKILKTGR